MHPSILLLLILFLGTAKGTETGGVVLSDKIPAEEMFVGSLMFDEEAVSAVECVAMCMNTPGCKSMTTSTDSPPSSSVTCRGYAFPTATTTTTVTAPAPAAAATAHSRFFNPWTDIWVLHRSEWMDMGCSSDPDCGSEPQKACVASSCLCSPGYYYSLSRDSCLQNCSLEHHLHAGFLQYPGFAINSHNLSACLNTSQDGCVQWCSSRHHASACDFWLPPSPPTASTSENLCCAQTGLEVEAKAWVEDPVAVHYQKMCV